MSDESETRSKSGGLNRRTLLCRSAAVAGGVAAAQALLPTAAKAQTRPTKVRLNDGRFTVAAMGEAMVGRPFSTESDPAFQALVKLLREADLTYVHLETSLADDDELTWAYRGSTGAAGYLVTDGSIAREFAWAGVDAMSLGMNHSYDWGPEGIFATIKHARDAGIAVAGTGKNLEAARAPAYFQLDQGRAALISVSSGNSGFEWAGLPKGEIPGRPGVNPLRVRTVYEVPQATAEQMKAAGRGLGVMNEAAAAQRDFNLTPGALSGSNGYAGFTFREGDRFGITSESHPGDLRGNLRAIEEARQLANYVMVAHHNSTSEGSRSQDPSNFVIDFARKAIDAGADVYFGHGWHNFLGIEIYRGKPIFYGMGSMFVQSNFMMRVPADAYESYNFDMDDLTKLHAASGNLHPGGGPDWGWGALYQLVYADEELGANRRLVEVLLHPVELGWDFTVDPPRKYRVVGVGEHEYLAGDPRLATGPNRDAILEKLRGVNARRGTDMAIRNGVGVITAS